MCVCTSVAFVNAAGHRAPIVMYTLPYFDKYTHLQINLAFTRDSTEFLVYDILQLNMLHQGRLLFQLVLSSRYRSIFSSGKLLTSWLRNYSTAHDRFRPFWSSSGSHRI
ncbi:hypothetical protein CSKR_112630 [Clonorchis sinensis]|uniref:Uncharacterized protein n=1 Tax=Clonorchis sinensis TaxID=79923 RepID=A0A3R7G847_CLOSI|nr:hypothetical protein CSKR_112630 [Clonorchis sinensis]